MIFLHPLSNICNQSCFSLPGWDCQPVVCLSKNFNIWHWVQTFQPNSFIPAMCIGMTSTTWVSRVPLEKELGIVRGFPSGNPLVCILIYLECACVSNELKPHTWQSVVQHGFLTNFIYTFFVHFVCRFVRHICYNSSFRSILNLSFHGLPDSRGICLVESQTAWLKSMTKFLLDLLSFTPCEQHMAASWWEGHSCFKDWPQHTFIAL